MTGSGFKVTLSKRLPPEESGKYNIALNFLPNSILDIFAI